MPFDPTTAQAGAPNAFDPSTAKAEPETPSLLSRATAPLRAIPSAIASEFGAGAKQIREGMTGARGGPLSPGPALKVVGGAVQEAFSPITGTAKALVGDPVRAQFPKDSTAGKFVGNLTEDAASMFGPAAVEKSLSAVGSALPKLNESVKTLMDAGVRLTPGQIFRATAGRVEETLRAIPGVAGFVSKAQLQSVEDFNRVILNRGLAKAGLKLPDDIAMGRQAIAKADELVSAGYDKILPKLTFDPAAGATPTSSFNSRLAAIVKSNERTLTPAQQQQYIKIAQMIDDHLDAAGKMSGAAYKEVESAIGHIYRTYAASDVPADQFMARSLNELRGEFKAQLAVSNPAYAKKLGDLNAAWATLSPARDASIRNVKTGGLFSPADLLRALKDSSSTSMFAHGQLELQPLADAASFVLPENISGLERGKLGLYERGLWLALLGGGGEYVSPGLALALGGATSMYTRPGIAATNAMVRGAPEAARAASAALRSAPAAAGSAAFSAEGQDQ